MSRSFLPLASIDDLDRALLASATHPILIFKHSPTCGTSAMAHEELQDVLEDETIPAPIYLLHIQAARDVSAEIERRLTIRHESPQLLLVDNGAVVWHGSHFRVTGAQVRASLAKLATA